MDKSRTIMVITSEYSELDEPKCMTRELVHALAARGHNIRVVALSWRREGPAQPHAYIESEAIHVLRLPRFDPQWLGTRIAQLAKWWLTSWRWRGTVRRWLVGQSVDLLFVPSPAVIAGAIIKWAMRRHKPVGYFYPVDFFPFHQRAIGLVPGGAIFQVALSQETALIRQFDVIGCMSDANIRYLQDHYDLRSEQRVRLLRLGIAVQPPAQIDRHAVRTINAVPTDRIVILFGGQITEGRGVEEMLTTARIAHENGSGLFFILIGQGRLTPLVEAYVMEGRDNLLLFGARQRDAYLELAAACDIGLVATVRDVDVPTFPSKTLDYLLAGLPVVASVEASTDYAELIEHEGFGSALEAGNSQALYERLTEIAADAPRRARMAQAGRHALETIFNVDTMAGSMLDESHKAEDKTTAEDRVRQS